MAAAYTVRIERRAIKALQSLPRRVRKQISHVIDALAENPRPDGTRKLAAAFQIYRIRVGQYRLIYEVRDKELLVLVLKIGHRKDIYRH